MPSRRFWRHGHFKCNLRRIVDYPTFSGYLRNLYQKPGIGETVNIDHTRRHYYGTHEDLNPGGIVLVGPEKDLTAPEHHDFPAPRAPSATGVLAR